MKQYEAWRILVDREYDSKKRRNNEVYCLFCHEQLMVEKKYGMMSAWFVIRHITHEKGCVCRDDNEKD